MSEAQLGSLLENETNAKLLWKFLHVDHTHIREPRAGHFGASSVKESSRVKRTRGNTGQGGRGQKHQKKSCDLP